MNTDLVSILGNLSRSLFSVQTLISGFGYLLGVMFIITGIMKLKKIGSGRRGQPSQEKMTGPVMYFLVGAGLVFLPTFIKTLSNSAFGGGNILQYIPYNPNNIYNSMGILLQTAGLLWFVRGCVLIVHGSEPGAKEGLKGLMFLAAGILAMNFQFTYGALGYLMSNLLLFTGMRPSGS